MLIGARRPTLKGYRQQPRLSNLELLSDFQNLRHALPDDSLATTGGDYKFYASQIMHLLLLDIDGTLTDTNDVDTSCFVQALRDVFALSEISTDWSAYPDATDSAITAHVVRDCAANERVCPTFE